MAGSPGTVYLAISQISSTVTVNRFLRLYVSQECCNVSVEKSRCYVGRATRFDRTSQWYLIRNRTKKTESITVGSNNYANEISLVRAHTITEHARRPTRTDIVGETEFSSLFFTKGTVVSAVFRSNLVFSTGRVLHWSKVVKVRCANAVFRSFPDSESKHSGTTRVFSELCR